MYVLNPALLKDMKIFLGPVEASLARDAITDRVVIIILANPCGYCLYDRESNECLMADGTWKGE